MTACSWEQKQGDPSAALRLVLSSVSTAAAGGVFCKAVAKGQLPVLARDSCMLGHSGPTGSTRGSYVRGAGSVTSAVRAARRRGSRTLRAPYLDRATLPT
jgi:hypothetical protein